MERMTWTEAERHAGQMLEPWYIENDIRPVAERCIPHYLFTEGDEKHRTGWCSACKQYMDLSPAKIREKVPQWVMEDPYRWDEDEEPALIPDPDNCWWDRKRYTGRTLHLDYGYCPECGAKIRHRGMWRGHSSETAKRFLIRYEKSRLDPENVMVCVGYELRVEWRYMDRNDPDVPMEIRPREVCVFRWGEGGQRFMLERRWCEMGGWDENWVRRNKCESRWSPGMMGNRIRTILDNRSLAQAAENTPWAHLLRSESDVWHTQIADWFDRIALVDRLAKFPCIEYLYRLGQGELADAALDGTIGRRISPRGKTAAQVLRLTGDEWGEVKGKKLRLTPDALDIHRLARRRKWRMNMELIQWCGWKRDSFEHVKRIAGALPGGNPVKELKYARKKNVLLRDYVDHLRMMEQLGMTMTETEFLMPKDFLKCHAELGKRCGDLQDAGKTAKILERLESGTMDEYFFSAAGFVLRPAFTAGEIVEEGNIMSHCVGRYVDNHAKGTSNICFLRNEETPQTARYTVEFGRDGRLIQCRGYNNDRDEKAIRQREADADRLELFWAAFEAYRADLRAANKKKRKGKAA